MWPSSTKAEMLAYLTALLTAPCRSKVKIYTDSQATIDRFYRLPDFSHLSARKREKHTNYPIWYAMSYIIDHLDLNVMMIKVKAHSDDQLNDLADQLAKKAIQEGPLLNLKLTIILAIRMIMTCDNLEIEALSR